jgi:hypothetical protein
MTDRKQIIEAIAGGDVAEDLGDAFHRLFEMRPLRHEFDTRTARAAWRFLMGEKIEKDSPIELLFSAVSVAGAYACRDALAKRLGCEISDIIELEEEAGEHFIEAAERMVKILNRQIQLERA